MNYSSIILSAIKAKELSYSPYSNFQVGAALLCKSGSIYTGCNIENAAFSPTNCAERTAIFKAISEGEKEFDAIAIVGSASGKEADYCYPCGICRQVIREFVQDDFIVIVAKSETDYRIHNLGELLPYSFGAEDLMH